MENVWAYTRMELVIKTCPRKLARLEHAKAYIEYMKVGRAGSPDML